MTTTRRTLVAAALCAAALGSGATDAHASLHVELPPDPVAGEPLELRVSGVAEPRSLVRAGVADGGADCADRGRWFEWVDERVAGAFDLRETAHVTLEPGVHQLCAWLLRDREEGPYEQVAIPFTVREGRFEVHVDAPAVLPLGAEVRAEVSGFGDGTPNVLLAVTRSILQGCESPGLWAANVTVRGPFAFARRLTRVQHHGEHLVCAQVAQRGHPVATSEAVVQVTEGCTRADRRLLRASAAVRTTRRRLRGGGWRARRALRRAKAELARAQEVRAGLC